MRSFDHGWHWQDVERTLEGRNLLIAQEGFQHSLSPNKQRRSVFPAYPPARQEEPDGAAHTPVNGGDPHNVADFREGREVSHELRHPADQTDLPSSTASERVSLLLSQIAKNQPTNTAGETSPAEADQSDLPSTDNFVDEEVAPPVRKKKKLKPVPKQPVPNINIDLSFGQTAEQAWGHESLEHMGDTTSNTARQPQPPTSQVSRMERTQVETFNLRAMDPKLAVYRGDQRFRINKAVPPPEKKKHERQIRATSHDNIRDSLATRCCKTHGIFNSCMSQQQLMCIRDNYHNNLSSVQRQNFVANIFFEKLHRGSFEVDGLAVCWNGLKLALGISDGTLSAARLRMVWGINKTEFMRTTNNWAAPMTTAISLWLDHFILKWTEKMPHKTCLHLPSSYTKTAIWMLCCDEVKFVVKGTLKPVSVRLFLQVWADNFSHVKIPRLNSFAQCNFCSRWGLMKQNKLLTKEQRLVLDEDKKGEVHEQISLICLLSNTYPVEGCQLHRQQQIRLICSLFCFMLSTMSLFLASCHSHLRSHLFDVMSRSV